MPEPSKWLDDLKALADALENGDELPPSLLDDEDERPQLRVIQGGREDA
jgi:hypothetical protein